MGVQSKMAAGGSKQNSPAIPRMPGYTCSDPLIVMRLSTPIAKAIQQGPFLTKKNRLISQTTVVLVKLADSAHQHCYGNQLTDPKWACDADLLHCSFQNRRMVL